MRSKLYKLALWYIKKCNAEWNNRSFKNDLEALDKLTYWNFGKYMLNYGADAEWQIFSRYEVLDNAIQKLGKYENTPTVTEAEIRNKAIDDFIKVLDKNKHLEKWTNYYDEEECDWVISIDKAGEIAEQLKGK